MPTYRNISIMITSQYDCLNLPEYAPRSDLNDPFSDNPMLKSPSQPLVSVYVPAYPSSTFWLSYSISPPHPPKAQYYFKLFINGNHFVSWGCGEKERFTGKTMFGLYRGRNGEIERRVLSFGPEDDSSGAVSIDIMEVRVYRSKGRRKAIAEVEPFESEKRLTGKTSETKNGGLRFLNAGILRFQHPKNYYQYALLDPLDTPFATFRFYFGPWEELSRLSETAPPRSPVRILPSLSELPAPTRTKRDSILSFASLYTPPERIPDYLITIPDPPSPDADSPLRLPNTLSLSPFALPRPPSPPRFNPDSPRKILPGASHENAALPAQPRTPTPKTKINRRLFSRNSPPKREEVPSPSPSPTPLSGDSNRRADFGGIVAELMRRSPSPERGRPKGRNRGRNVRGGSLSPDPRRAGFDALGVVVEEEEEEGGLKDEVARKVRRAGSMAVLRGALDTVAGSRSRGKGRMSTDKACEESGWEKK
ncbi:hypothetical protein MMC13_003596 [Lambiella insularis]|nr:hypothetical protein [Lambiella insularis]